MASMDAHLQLTNMTERDRLLSFSRHPHRSSLHVLREFSEFLLSREITCNVSSRGCTISRIRMLFPNKCFAFLLQSETDLLSVYQSAMPCLSIHEKPRRSVLFSFLQHVSRPHRDSKFSVECICAILAARDSKNDPSSSAKGIGMPP